MKGRRGPRPAQNRSLRAGAIEHAGDGTPILDDGHADAPGLLAFDEGAGAVDRIDGRRPGPSCLPIGHPASLRKASHNPAAARSRVSRRKRIDGDVGFADRGIADLHPDAGVAAIIAHGDLAGAGGDVGQKGDLAFGGASPDHSPAMVIPSTSSVGAAVEWAAGRHRWQAPCS